MADTDGADLLMASEVAVLLRAAERTVRHWAATGRLRCIRTPSKGLRFRREDVEKFLADAAVAPVAAVAKSDGSAA